MPENKVKLLIVDDEGGIVEWVTRIYSEKGFATFGATDGISAVELFQKERPHITVIDIHMPRSSIDGVETLKRIKEIDSGAICLMVTRMTDKDKVEECRRLGALHYITKPLTLDELDKVINSAVSVVKKKG